MPDVIQCPTCSKRFRLPAKPPATFACTGCGTTMDLSGFQPRETEAAPASAAAVGASSGAATERPRRSTREGGSSTASRRSSVSSRRRRDEDDGAEDRFAPPPKKSNAVLWVSLACFVVVIGIALIVTMKKSPPAPPPETPPAEAGAGGGAPASGAHAPPAAHAGAMTTAPTDTPPAESGDTPPPPAGKKAYVSSSKVTFHPVDHHPDAKEDERKQIDDLIQLAVFQNAGSDSLRAEKDLIKIGMHAAPRVINVFSTIKASPEGFESRDGRLKASVADRVLRGIDGYLDRKNKGHLTLLKAQHASSVVEKIARQWLAWWDNDLWKHPEPPWDEAKDGNRGEKQDPDDKPAAPPTEAMSEK